MTKTTTSANAITITKTWEWAEWPDYSKCIELHDAIEWVSKNRGLIEFHETPDTPLYVFCCVLNKSDVCAGTTTPVYVNGNPIQAVIDAVKVAHDALNDEDK